MAPSQNSRSHRRYSRVVNEHRVCGSVCRRQRHSRPMAVATSHSSHNAGCSGGQYLPDKEVVTRRRNYALCSKLSHSSATVARNATGDIAVMRPDTPPVTSANFALEVCLKLSRKSGRNGFYVRLSIPFSEQHAKSEPLVRAKESTNVKV